MIPFILVNRPPLQTFVRISQIQNVMFDNTNRKIAFRVVTVETAASYVETYSIEEVSIYNLRVATIKKMLNTVT